VVIAVTGLVQAIDRHGSQRVNGALAFALFSVAALVHASWLLRRTPGGLEHLKIGKVDIDEAEMPAFLLTHPAWWKVMIFAPLLAFGLWGATVAATSRGDSSEGARIVGLVVPILFGGFGLMGLATIRRPQGIALTRSGLVYLTIRRPKLIAWDSISEVGRRRLKLDFILQQQLVGISLKSAEGSDGAGRLERLNRRLSGWDHTLPARWLDIDPDVLERVLRRYVMEPDARRTIGSASGLEQLRAAVIAS